MPLERTKVYFATMLRNAARLTWPVAAAVCVAACADPNAPAVEEPQAFITMRRAWQPGERESTIVRIERDGGFGALSVYARDLYADTESVTVVVSNPDFSARAAAPSGLMMAPTFQSSWNISGWDILVINNEVQPADTTRWLEVLWSNPAETNWFGFAIAAVSGPTVTQIYINTPAFDSTFGKVGAGAGEFRTSTTTYWQGNGGGGANANFMTISAASYGSTSTVTTGPYLGGTMASGTMLGRMKNITLTRQYGSTTPTTTQADLDFTSVAISALQIDCRFRTPCTTNAAPPAR